MAEKKWRKPRPKKSEVSLYQHYGNEYQCHHGFCVLCGKGFLLENGYTEMGLCSGCARKAGAAWVYKHSGESHHMLDPEGFAAEQAERDRERALRPPKKAISAKLRLRVFERDGYCCKHCGGTDRLRADHIWPESKGGSATLENLQTLCHRCNSAKGNRIPEGAVLQ